MAADRRNLRREDIAAAVAGEGYALLAYGYLIGPDIVARLGAVGQHAAAA